MSRYITRDPQAYAKRQRADIVTHQNPPDIARALTAETCPPMCLWCKLPASGGIKDENGNWTWNCYGGCNP